MLMSNQKMSILGGLYKTMWFLSVFKCVGPPYPLDSYNGMIQVIEHRPKMASRLRCGALRRSWRHERAEHL